MAIPEWLLGPAGDLRPLPPMEMDVVNNVDRFGGVHTSINGSRTVDVLGFKSRYELEIRHMKPEEYNRLEALYTQQIPGPFYLVDPLRRNLVSRESSSARPSGAGFRGLSAAGGALSWVKASDSPLEWTKRAAEWHTFEADNTVRFDYGRRIPLVSGQPITFSVYANPSEDVQLRARFQCYVGNQGAGTVSGEDTECPAGEWTRVTVTIPDTENYDEVSPELQFISGGSDSTKIKILGAQAEYADEPTEATLGGGSVLVVFEQMDTTSPYYPYQSAALTLLEV